MFSPKANMNIYVFHINHIAIGMCNSLKCSLSLSLSLSQGCCFQKTQEYGHTVTHKEPKGHFTHETQALSLVEKAEPHQVHFTLWLRDHGTPNVHNRWFILFYHVWGPAWIEIHRKSIWVRARSHMASHYTLGSVTTLHDFWGALGRPLATFFWALTMSWSRLLAHMWSGAKYLVVSSSSMYKLTK
jgi:hypothetical protein